MEDYPPPSATLESISMFSNFAAFSLRSSMSRSRPVGVSLTLISFSSRISTNLDLYHKLVLSIKKLHIVYSHKLKVYYKNKLY